MKHPPSKHLAAWLARKEMRLWDWLDRRAMNVARDAGFRRTAAERRICTYIGCCDQCIRDRRLNCCRCLAELRKPDPPRAPSCPECGQAMHYDVGPYPRSPGWAWHCKSWALLPDGLQVKLSRPGDRPRR